jgi:hypothetical protein
MVNNGQQTIRRRIHHHRKEEDFRIPVLERSQPFVTANRKVGLIGGDVSLERLLFDKGKKQQRGPPFISGPPVIIFRDFALGERMKTTFTLPNASAARNTEIQF